MLSRFFFQRRKKANENIDKTLKSEKNDETDKRVLLESSDEEGDDAILTVKRRDHEIQDKGKS